MSLLNVDLKIIWKSISDRWPALPDLISSQQTVYNKSRHISGNGRLISVIEIISNFSFVFILEILFLLAKSYPEVEGLTICNYSYSYSAYADDTTFFLQNIISIKHMINIFFWGVLFQIETKFLKIWNLGIAVFKGAQVAVCGMRFINLISNGLKRLNTHYSYSKKNWKRKKAFISL